MKLCKYEGCNRPFQARELCSRHYQLLMSGQPLRPIREPYSLEESLEEFGQETELKTDLEIIRDALRVLEKHLES